MEEEGNAVGLAAGAMKRMTMVSDSGGLVNPNLNVPRPTLVSELRVSQKQNTG